MRNVFVPDGDLRTLEAPVCPKCSGVGTSIAHEMPTDATADHATRGVVIGGQVVVEYDWECASCGTRWLERPRRSVDWVP